MKSVVLRHAGQAVAAEFPDACELTIWEGPVGSTPDLALELVRKALDEPVDAPPLSLSVVPGDRIVIGLDSSGPGSFIALRGVVEQLIRAETASITVVTPVAVDEALKRAMGAGIDWVVNQPGDREQLAYLASTKAGRRVYLSRVLTDADAVVLIAQAGHDDRGRSVGPWTLLDVSLSDNDALLRDRLSFWTPEEAVDDAAEVAWLMGNPFQVAIIPGGGGAADVLAGSSETFRESVTERLERDTCLAVEERHDLVIAGIGDGVVPTTWDDLARAFASARNAVRRGGRIVVLSDLSQPVGPAIGRLLEVGDDRNALRRLRGLESSPDWNVARSIVETRDWADVFLMSKLDGHVVEELGLLPVDSPREAARLSRDASSCLILNQADRTWVKPADSPKEQTTP